MNKLLLAHGAAAVSALSAGAAVVATRFVIGETDPISLVFYRYFISIVCLAPLLWLLWPSERLHVADYARIAMFGILFFIFFPWGFNASLEVNPAGRGAVGLATIPIQTLIVAVIFGRERLTTRKVIGVLLAFVGMSVAFGLTTMADGDISYLQGDLIMLLGGFCAAMYSVFSRPTLMRFGPLFVTALSTLFAVLFLIPVMIIRHGHLEIPTFSTQGWMAVVFLGSIAGALQFSLFTWALRWLAPSTAVLYLTLNPMSAMVLGILFLGEALTVELVTGMTLVIVGVLIGSGVLASRRQKPADAG